jgi:hypothetical protein
VRINIYAGGRAGFLQRRRSTPKTEDQKEETGEEELPPLNGIDDEKGELPPLRLEEGQWLIKQYGKRLRSEGLLKDQVGSRWNKELHDGIWGGAEHSDRGNGR